MPEPPLDYMVTVPPKFPLIIPAPTGIQHPAIWALQQEGLDPLVRECTEDIDYGNLVADAWEAGTGFVLVEHDVVPWWGACRELWECEEEWCAFPYPQGQIQHEGGRIGYPDAALGCCKFSAALTKRLPSLHHDFRNAHWMQLQERLLPYLWNSGYQWHKHWPPVAHARQRKE